MENNLTRPKWNGKMESQLAEITGRKVNEWCNNETSLEDCIESAHKILKFNSNSDGYELAKEFEDDGFRPDVELVEILNSVSYDKIKIQEAFIKEWVMQNNLALELSEGQKVVVKLLLKGEVECEIVKLYPDKMQYGVWYEGQCSEKGKGHTIVDCENIVSFIATN